MAMGTRWIVLGEHVYETYVLLFDVTSVEGKWVSEREQDRCSCIPHRPHIFTVEGKTHHYSTPFPPQLFVCPQT